MKKEEEPYRRRGLGMAVAKTGGGEERNLVSAA